MSEVVAFSVGRWWPCCSTSWFFYFVVTYTCDDFCQLSRLRFLPLCFILIQTDFFSRCGCASCYHCLRSGGSCCHLETVHVYGNNFVDKFHVEYSNRTPETRSRGSFPSVSTWSRPTFSFVVVVRCFHCLRSCGSCHHLGGGVSLGHGKDFFDGCHVSGCSKRPSQVDW